MNTKDRQEIEEKVWNIHLKNMDNTHELKEHFCRACVNLTLELTEQKTKDEIIMKLENMLIDDLDYPQRNYAYLLHKKDFNRLKQSVKE